MDLVVQTVPVGRIALHPANGRRGDVDAIVASLERFGQLKPIVVQKSTALVIAGNHVLEAARKLGWETVDIVVVDVTDEQAKAYLLADNRTHDKGGYDNDAVVALLEDVMDLTGTGYTIDDLEDLQGAIEEKTEVGEAKRAQATPESHGRGGTPQRMRDIVLLMPVKDAEDFGRQVQKLQKAWGTTTVVDTVRQAVAEAEERLGY